MLLQIHAFTQQRRRCLQTRHHADPVTHASHYLLLSWQAHSTSGAATLASHNKMWWATLDRKCWHAYFSLPPSVRIKQDFFFFSLSEVSLLCFSYSSVRFLIFKLIQLWLRSWLLPTQVPEQMLATVRFCKTTEMLKLYFLFLFVKLFSLGFNFSISICDNTVRVFCLGFRHQNHLVRVRKRSFLA